MSKSAQGGEVSREPDAEVWLNETQLSYYNSIPLSWQARLLKLRRDIPGGCPTTQLAPTKATSDRRMAAA